ncbi:hypothetical protein K440DRAFT_628644 [Wilcoxina mikolae CBS 423.85]|nr:hypothetical protein K440DRAFT_628644 [Wilcoxina mikolae CBS 423.85]
MPPKSTFPTNANKRPASTNSMPKSPHKKLKPNNPQAAKAKRAWPTIFDAISSRVNYEGFIRPAFLNEFKEERVRSGVARPADEVLARRIRAPDNVAPVDSEEYDARLPDNDLMIAIHQYAADFYSAHGMAPISSKSMDETALIAMGMYRMFVSAWKIIAKTYRFSSRGNN